jgi:hypothetical protein
MRTRIRTALATLAALALATGGAVVGGAAPAQAAGTVQLSPDGASYSTTMSGALFSGTALVPGDDVAKPFWVRNASTEAAYLRVTLADVTVHDQDFGDQLAVRASLTGWPGSPVAVTAAQPCYVLSQGPVLPSGSSAKVTTEMQLGDLVGLAGQAGRVSFTLIVTLTSEALNTLPATDCPSTGTTVIGVVGDPATGGTTVTRGGGTVVTGGGTSVGPGSDGGPLTTQPTTGDAGSGGSTTTDPAFILESNTGRLWQELDVAFWLALAIAGALVAVARHRRKDSEEGAAP